MPALSESTVHVRGLRELNRAFAQADKTLKREKNHALRRVAEPVADDAELLARLRIRNIGVEWSRMRVGVTQRAVYVAPKQRGVRSRAGQRFRRPNLAGLLMDEAMEPALDANARQVERELDGVLREMERAWEQAR